MRTLKNILKAHKNAEDAYFRYTYYKVICTNPILLEDVGCALSQDYSVYDYISTRCCLMRFNTKTYLTLPDKSSYAMIYL